MPPFQTQVLPTEEILNYNHFSCHLLSAGRRQLHRFVYMGKNIEYRKYIISVIRFKLSIMGVYIKFLILTRTL